MSSDTTSALVFPQSEIFSASIYEPLFWRPRFLANTSVLKHAPFLFWLTAVAQPRRIAVLGAGDGQAHFVFCQAIDKLNLQATCFGLGFWEDHGSRVDPSKPPTSLAEHEEQLYTGISELISCESLESAKALVSPREVDMLFIDLTALGTHSPPEMDAWIALLEGTATLVVHGTNNLTSANGGGARILNAINKLDCFQFTSGEGLTVCLLGSGTPARLSSLLAACDGMNVPRDVSGVFHQLGEGLSAIENVRRLQKDSQTQHIAEQERARAEAELDELRHVHEQYFRRLAETHSRMFDLQESAHENETRIMELEATTKTLTVERDRLQAQLTEFEVSSTEMLTIRENTLGELEHKLQVERDTHFDETATLTRIAEEARQQLENCNTGIAQTKDAFLAKQKELNERLQVAISQADITDREKQALAFKNQEIEKKNNALAALITEFRESTSWRITAPLRKIKRRLTRD